MNTALEQSYAALNSLLEVTKPFPFTFGFASQRVLLNNILTTDTSLASLRKEFSKRGMGAVCFLPDLSVDNFKRGLALLVTKPEAIEQAGGIKAFLDQNPIGGMRILPAGKQEKEGEDTELETDAESFLAGQYSGEKSCGPGLRGLDILLQSAGIEMPDKLPNGGGGLFTLAEQAAPDGDCRPPTAIRGFTVCGALAGPGRVDAGKSGLRPARQPPHGVERATGAGGGHRVG